jgi:hypothetical protein
VAFQQLLDGGLDLRQKGVVGMPQSCQRAAADPSGVTSSL